MQYTREKEIIALPECLLSLTAAQMFVITYQPARKVPSKKISAVENVWSHQDNQTREEIIIKLS